MSVFTPYSRYQTAYQVLKPGDVIKIQDAYYLVITVRHNRKLVALTGAQTKLALNVSTLAAYESLHGNLQKNRITHIQYVAITESNTPEFYWGTQPLQSKDVDDTLNVVTAGLDNPIAVDRWSYDISMYLFVSESGSQNYYFEVIEYEIVSYAGTPPRPYLQIMANGQAVFVETQTTESVMNAIKLGPTR